jgi:hypothetical protein
VGRTTSRNGSKGWQDTNWEGDRLLGQLLLFMLTSMESIAPRLPSEGSTYPDFEGRIKSPGYFTSG